MYILTEIFCFIELLCTRGVDHAKESPFYQLIHNIIANEYVDASYAVPYYALFENIDYVDTIVHDFVHPTVVYDDIIKCFVFRNMHSLFIGLKSILKKLHNEYPNDQNIQDKFHQITMFVSIVNESMSLDDLCESMNKL